ncbi:MAG: DUF192 domain-containing protein [Micavibrio aeruginosavorus]|uniref:DUF192 domain-containing protein n=1 Tax=Micavibrio aeruginosavorus TaxID=349221 RepID=A0A2W5PME8_9BACT|nr:MAG: DUF192 domain-containing protein [Micavibrio aeruginosavorus]
MFVALCTLAACDDQKQAQTPVPDPAVAETSDNSAQNADSTHVLQILARDGKIHPFTVELALTPQQQAKGLMFRETMAENAGMLFYFGGEAIRSFWMKNTLIPLDMIFIGKDGTIVNVHANAVPNDLTAIKSEGPAAAVLELNGGTAGRLGIQAGDKVRHVFFGNAR